ncbi:MAG: SUMF1/EgtB/PvdO family nonheme iron enzyme, partial [Anaerolinea sp.]|nr:SUMF1/EgtB/PvdO family nonheme iron enzyme [Anaerolinea sp.]
FPNGASVEGIHDLSGNVWEWCLNKYSNPEQIGLEGGARRVLRGGSWNDDQYSARAERRNLNDPFVRSDYSGLRLACSSPNLLNR